MNILLSPSSGEAIYLQIVRQIRDSILQGELAPGEALPSIRQLAKDLQISVITTKRAYNELEQEGLIDSIVGKGSFVSGGNKAFIIEQRTRMLEEKLREVLVESRNLSISTKQLIEMIQLLELEEKGEE
ncbi:HTH-type transcriptional repressor YtrA [compost metagenome]